MGQAGRTPEPVWPFGRRGQYPPPLRNEKFLLFPARSLTAVPSEISPLTNGAVTITNRRHKSGDKIP